MTIAVGDTLPELTLKDCSAEGMNEITVSELFGGKKVVLFAVPGAFTPTCDLNHLPGYLQHRDDILAKGIDDIAVVAVNDGFVMTAWAKSSGGDGKIHFLADWDAAFTKAIGMDIDLSAGTLGVRSQRYSMVVDDRVVKAIHLEDSPGEAVISGAERLLQDL